MHLNMKSVDKIIEMALEEDMGTGDVTTLSTVPEGAVTKGFLYAKGAGVVAGLPVAERVFQVIDEAVVFKAQKRDGDTVSPGDILATVEGPARPILSGERVALNLLQRMSGIATRTARIAKMLSHTGTTVIDTRKTVPGLRVLDKYAVRTGGGGNHRFGLYDGVLIKDNHIKVAGGIGRAVAMARAAVPHVFKIEVEVESLDGVKEALEAGADVIMLDNMDIPAIKEAVSVIDGRALVEVSGGIDERNVLEYAEAGVSMISVGALTHSVLALDISLDVGTIKYTV